MSRKIAIVAIQHPDHEDLYLHGLRSDDGTWCIPGGHFESGEDKNEAAKRELFEETGLTADLEFVHDEQTTDYQGKPLHIFLFTGKNPAGKLSAVNDPDAEFKEFKFINPESDAYKFRVPREKNVLLTWLHSQKLSKSMFEDETLAKVEEPPMVVGQVNDNGDIAVKHHQQQNLLVWNHSPAKQKYFQTLVDQHKGDFIQSLPEKNRASAEKLINKVSKDPGRHYIATRNRLGGHDLRLRHLGSLIVGDRASSVLPHDDGTITISQERHGRNPQVSSWHVDHKGSVTDVSKQHGYKHPIGAMEFTQSSNRQRFGKDFGLFPQKPEKLTEPDFSAQTKKLGIIKGEDNKYCKNSYMKEISHNEKKIIKKEPYTAEGSEVRNNQINGANHVFTKTINIPNDSRRISEQVGGVAFKTRTRDDRRGEGTLSGLHRGDLLKSYVVLPMTLDSLSKSGDLATVNNTVCMGVLYKSNIKIPAVIIENPSNLEEIIKHAVLHNCEYIVMASGNKAEILYTKGKHSGTMKTGLSNTMQKSEPVFGIRVDEGQFVEFGSADHLYHSPSPFVVPKS